MKTWYCMTSSFDDRGRVTAGITATTQADKKPQSSYIETPRKDIYADWFGSEAEAWKFVEEAKKA